MGIRPTVEFIFLIINLIMRNNACVVRRRAKLKDVERLSNNGLVCDLKEEQSSSMHYCDETSHDIEVESWKLLLWKSTSIQRWSPASHFLFLVIDNRVDSTFNEVWKSQLIYFCAYSLHSNELTIKLDLTDFEENRPKCSLRVNPPNSVRLQQNFKHFSVAP